MKTQVGIIGAGPAGLTLALLLHEAGISSVILENKSKEYITSRVRAGLLEHNTVEILEKLGLADRLHKEGLVHHGCYISHNGISQHIDFDKLTQKKVTIYGQQEIVKDLVQACATRNIEIKFETEVIEIVDFETNSPILHFISQGSKETISCDFIAGCDGFHGISRKTLPTDSYNSYNIEYPFSWLGILAHASPTYKELIYAYHDRGFALASMRSESIVRLYLQVPNADKIENWKEADIWAELELRLGIKLNRGEIFEKGITPMRSFMIDNMQVGNLFLAGDAAHIVPPTGAKGLNLAMADVHNLAAGFVAYYDKNSKETLNNYTKLSLARVWRVQDFSNFMTNLCHHQEDPFEQKLQKAKFDYLRVSESYRKTIAENYVGLPLDLFAENKLDQTLN